MMGTLSFKNQTITVVRAGVLLERGDELLDWDDATEHFVDDCRLQPMATEEVLFSGASANEGGVARDAVITRWKLFAPYDADIDPRDRIRHDDVEYEVDGQVQRWPSPTGRLAHAEAVLRRVEG